MLQEEMVPFFSQLKLSPQNNTAELAYIEIANKVCEKLVEGYFQEGRTSWQDLLSPCALARVEKFKIILCV
jgi:hypothetical protein